jgi:hypothetical protein
MNKLRELLLQEREAKAKELFEAVKDNPNPEIFQLWELTEVYFIEWRKRHDFPKLLKHFNKTLLLFVYWKSDNKLTDEIIINTGYLTRFLEHKKISKNKTLYLVEQTFNGKTSTFVSDNPLNGERTEFGAKYRFKIILKFHSYLDWLKQKGHSQKILNINSRTAPNSKHEKVSIHADIYSKSDDFELLKMGGIIAPSDGFGILMRGKRLEFVNICGLELHGQIYFGEEGNLSCSYCACDNLKAINLNMSSLWFEHCSLTNFEITNSKINSWRFYDCQVTGDFKNVQFNNVTIWGGQFRPIMQDCTMFNVDIEHDPSLKDSNYYAYKLFKKVYVDNGDDTNAIKYFIKEHDFIRKNSKGFQKILKTISYLYWGYGRKPQRIILNSLFFVVAFSLVYWIKSDHIVLNNGTLVTMSYIDCLYFSSTTFATLGYGDYSPIGILRIAAVAQSFLGVLNAGFLVVGLASNKY